MKIRVYLGLHQCIYRRKVVTENGRGRRRADRSVDGAVLSDGFKE